jgi:replication-associated recombination protein RarA
MKIKKSTDTSIKFKGPVHPQHDDVWSRCQTVNGYAVDEVRSVFQKSVRRGKVEEAILAAFELYMTGPETEELLWRRIEIIATEDVGLGLVALPAILEAMNTQRLRLPHNFDRWIYSAHAVRLIATAKKDRTSMELAAWAQSVVESGERKLEVLDFHVDNHTRRGVEMGRGVEFWWNNGGAMLLNQVEGLDPRWGKYLRGLYRKGLANDSAKKASKTTRGK